MDHGFITTKRQMKAQTYHPTPSGLQPLLAMVLLAAAQLATSMRCGAAIINVTTSVDTLDAPGLEDGSVSLREAITSINNAADFNADVTANRSGVYGSGEEIHFTIPGAGVHTIVMLSDLPALTTPMVIDGYTQPGASPNTRVDGDNAVILIELDANGFHTFSAFANRCTIRGLALFNNAGFGGAILLSASNRVAGNFIGLRANGNPLTNRYEGVGIAGDDNVVGGTTLADRNVISGNGAGGVGISGMHNVVAGNFIGTDLSGKVSIGNSLGIVINHGSSNTIGGSVIGARNVISGNVEDGIVILADGSGPPAPSGNTIEGNFIGTDVTGAVVLGNGGSGVLLELPASDNLVGVPGAGNVISGNGADGVHIIGQFNEVQANFIGTDQTGTKALSNQGSGVSIVSDGTSTSGIGNTIGGNSQGDGNVISGNHRDGVRIDGGVGGNGLFRNFIGTDISGTKAIANGSSGVEVVAATNTRIGEAVDDRNLISGNTLAGISLSPLSNQTTIENNLIGTDLSGQASLGNGGDGINSFGVDNLIGGTGHGNIIAFNNGNGIAIGAAPSFVGTQNRIFANSIFSNTKLGIDLEEFTPPNTFITGITPNDPCDVDSGANQLQNFPDLQSAVLDATIPGTTVTGVLNSTPNTIFVIEVFANDACVPNCQGKTFLGRFSVTTDANCHAPITATVAPLPCGTALTATATDPAGNTSEFSSDTIVVGAHPFAIACPGNITVCADPGQCSAKVTFGPPTQTGGECALSQFTYDPPSGSTFPVGTTPVRCDAFSGKQEQQCGFTVTVRDCEVPSIQCLPTSTVTADASCQTAVPVVAVTASDNCSPVSKIRLVQNPAPGTLVGLGPHPITVTATDEAGNSASCNTTFTVQGADLLISEAADKGTVKPGQTITYTITVNNLGPGTAKNVVVNDPVPQGTVFLSATNKAGIKITAPPVGSAGTVTWYLGDLAAQGTSTSKLVVTVQVRGNGSIVNTATVSSDTCDPNLANNTATVTTRRIVK
jgi:uncharacterized repeat protein (TIGR01451 family)